MRQRDVKNENSNENGGKQKSITWRRWRKLSKNIEEEIEAGDTLCIIKRQVDKSKCAPRVTMARTASRTFRYRFRSSSPFPVARANTNTNTTAPRNQCNWRTDGLRKWVNESCRLLWQQLFRGASSAVLPFLPPNGTRDFVCLSTRLHGNFRAAVLCLLYIFCCLRFYYFLCLCECGMLFEMFACHLCWQ